MGKTFNDTQLYCFNYSNIIKVTYLNPLLIFILKGGLRLLQLIEHVIIFYLHLWKTFKVPEFNNEFPSSPSH